MIVRVVKEWMNWRSHWDDLCNRCGKCCYMRYVTKSGKLIIDYSDPCENLDTKTKLCTVYSERFKKCRYCGKVGLWRALFNRTLPSDCAYVQTFRIWRR